MKHLKNSSSPQSLKRRFSRNVVLYLPAILFASLMGTYLDLIFVGKNLYEFPLRPFPGVFSINIAFTLVVLPFGTWVFLSLANKVSRWGRLVFALVISSLAPFIEKMSMQWGFFRHADQWNHLYSFVGYFVFFVLLWKVFKWGKVGVNSMNSNS